MDKRRERSFKTIRQQYRALVLLDKHVNKYCGPFPDKKDHEYPLVGIDMSGEESTNEDGTTGKALDYEDFYPETRSPVLGSGLTQTVGFRGALEIVTSWQATQMQLLLFSKT